MLPIHKVFPSRLHSAGVADYMKPCGKDGKMGPWDNVMPHSAQATLPPSAANITFHFRLQGWSSHGLYTVKPQTLQVWPIVQQCGTFQAA